MAPLRSCRMCLLGFSCISGSMVRQFDDVEEIEGCWPAGSRWGLCFPHLRLDSIRRRPSFSGVPDPALGTILPAWVLYSPAVGLALYFLPGAVVGILLAIKRCNALGLRVVLASLLLVGLLLLLDVLAFILARPSVGPF